MCLDKRLGQLTLVMKYPQCFEADFYAADLGVDAPEDRRLNFGECMLKGLFGRWAMETRMRFGEATDPIDVWGPGWIDRKKKKIASFRFWDEPRTRGTHTPSPFVHATDSTSVFVSSMTKMKEPWKCSVSDINARSSEHGEIPDWIADCVLHDRIPTVRELKCSFHLIPFDVGSLF